MEAGTPARERSSMSFGLDIQRASVFDVLPFESL